MLYLCRGEPNSIFMSLINVIQMDDIVSQYQLVLNDLIYVIQMDDIVSQYQLVLNDRRDISVPQQLLMFAERWNEDMRRLSMKIQDKPVIVIASRTEAMYYGRVKQVKHWPQ